MTYDAFAKGIVDHFRFALPEQLKPDARYLVNDAEVIDAAFRKAGFKNPLNWYPSRLKKYYESVLESVELPFKQDDLGERVWRLLLKGFDDYRPTLSFKMICILAEFIIRTNPMIKNGLRMTYKHVFLDEFQDTTDLQYKLVKQCFLNSSSIMTAVGDNKQRIMVWAGARKTIFNDFEDEFNAEVKHLVMNHRSAPRLVDLQRRMYASLNETNRIVMVSDKWDANDGKVALLISGDEEQEAEAIAKSIHDHVLDGTEPNKICILCKQKVKEYTSRIIADLAKCGICARIEDEYQNLIKEPIVEMVMSVLRLAIDRKRPRDWETVVSATLDIWNIESTGINDDYYEMQESLSKEIERIANDMRKVTNKQELKNLLIEMVRFWGAERIRATISVYGQGMYLDQIIERFLEYMWKELETVQMNWQCALERFEGLHSVPIMTIHKSKGLEYDVVYFIGLEDSSFWSFKKQPEEDRCTFFVALSRAKKEVCFTFCKYRNAQWQTHQNINEFFDLLQQPGIASVIEL